MMVIVKQTFFSDASVISRDVITLWRRVKRNRIADRIYYFKSLFADSNYVNITRLFMLVSSVSTKRRSIAEF
jgi:hypothetical protein